MGSGVIRKMKTELAEPVRYEMRMGDDLVPINEFVGKTFGLRFTGQYSCVLCGRAMKKPAPQGSCYPCFRNAPENSPCIIKPELCEAHTGGGRDPEWEKEHHLTPHVVYLSFTGAVKVGVTRATQVPTRWIDQGATMAVPIARVPYRQLAGAIEVSLKEHLADKTNWRNMIKGVDADASVLEEAKARIPELLPEALQEYLVDEEITHIHFPGEVVLPQVKSIKLEKVEQVEATLMGIRGQYLVWADGRVMNVRNHSGYHLELI